MVGMLEVDLFWSFYRHVRIQILIYLSKLRFSVRAFLKLIQKIFYLQYYHSGKVLLFCEEGDVIWWLFLMFCCYLFEISDSEMSKDCWITAYAGMTSEIG